MLFIYVCALLRNNFLISFHKIIGSRENLVQKTRNWILKSECTGIRRCTMITEVFKKNLGTVAELHSMKKKKFSNISGFQSQNITYCVKQLWNLRWQTEQLQILHFCLHYMYLKLFKCQFLFLLVLKKLFFAIYTADLLKIIRFSTSQTRHLGKLRKYQLKEIRNWTKCTSILKDLSEFWWFF